MKIYISGPITNDPDYKSRFMEAEKKLTCKGHKVWNPAVHSEGFEHHEYMAVCLPAVAFCDGIFMLEGWEHSVGATQELQYAISHNKEIYMECDR